PERLHSPHAARDERGETPVALPALPILDPVVPQRAAFHVAHPAWQVRQLPRSDLRALLPGRTAHGPRVPRLLADERRRISPGGNRVLRRSVNFHRRHVYRLRTLHHPGRDYP